MRDESKFDRLIAFGQALPRIRACVNQALSLHNRDKVLRDAPVHAAPVLYSVAIIDSFGREDRALVLGCEVNVI